MAWWANYGVGLSPKIMLGPETPKSYFTSLNFVDLLKFLPLVTQSRKVERIKRDKENN